MFEMYRHNLYAPRQTDEVAASAPPMFEVVGRTVITIASPECECPDQDPWRSAVHYHPDCPFYLGGAA